MPLPPIAAGFIVEFFREVFSELGKAIRRRRARRKREAEREKVRQAQEDMYMHQLAELKEHSKIPENPYDGK